MPYIGQGLTEGRRRAYNFVATGSQTTFSATYDVGYIDVYQNGILLNPATDYTSTTGTTVVLVTGASVNDVVEIVVYDAFSIANSYTKSESDTRYPFLGNDSIIRTNGQTISADITISSTTNALSAGPITVGASATLTVNGFYTIL